MKAIINLGKVPFSQLIESTVSALKVESAGSVIGEISESRGTRYFEVQALQLYQATQRKPASVNGEWREWENHKRFLDPIGSFHWHPYSRTTKNGEKIYEKGLLKLGITDKINLKQYFPRGIELLATINPVKRKKQIEMTTDTISGCIDYRGNSYQIEVAAFYMDKGRPRKAILDVKEDDIVAVLAS